MKILISIPVYISNDIHLEYTRKTVESIRCTHRHAVLLVVNYCDPQYLDELKKIAPIKKNPKGNILASAWNLSIDRWLRLFAFTE
jgi:hypothetical protein